jgi:hypothetical protein
MPLSLKPRLIQLSFTASIACLVCLVAAVGGEKVLPWVIPALGLAFMAVISGWLAQKRSGKKEIVLARRAKRFGLFVLLVAVYGIWSNVFEGMLSSWAYEAHESGIMVQKTQELYLHEHGTYAKGLDELIDVNPEIGKYTEVTFTFVHASASGFTIETRHDDHWKAYTFTEKVD